MGLCNSRFAYEMLALDLQNASVSFYFFSGPAAGALILIIRVLGGLIYLLIEPCQKCLPEVYMPEISNKRQSPTVIPGLY